MCVENATSKKTSFINLHRTPTNQNERNVQIQIHKNTFKMNGNVQIQIHKNSCHKSISCKQLTQMADYQTSYESDSSLSYPSKNKGVITGKNFLRVITV